MKLVPPLSALAGVQSSAERRVAKLLAEVDVREPAICFYSFHLNRHADHAMGEVDFLVVFEDAVISVEVKGGRIDRTNGMWSFTDRNGSTNWKHEGPFEQARRGMFATRDVVRKRLPSARIGYAALVVTPDQHLRDDAEWSRDEYLGPIGMTAEGLTRAVSAARASAVASGHSRGEQWYGELTRVLRPDFEVLPRLKETTAGIELEYVALRDQQYEVLTQLERNRRLLCEGGAGTGKTLVAAEAARRAADEGASVLFTCRSPQVVRLVAALLKGTGVTCRAFDDISYPPEPFDLLVVDEAQDLMNVDDLAALDDAVRGGLYKGRWRMFCDTNNQAHVDGAFDLEQFEELENCSSVWGLTENLRNTAPIVAQTQLITGADLGIPRIGGGPKVESLRVTAETAADALDERLRRFVQEEIPLQDVAVVTLSSSPDESSAIHTKAFREGRLRWGDGRSGTAGLHTPAQIKGLEASHVCLIDVEAVDDRAGRSKLYVAMSRARVSLWIAWSDEAWRQVRRNATKGALA